MSEFALRAIQSDVASASVVKMPVAKGVDAARAVQAMKERAIALDVGLVSHLSFSRNSANESGEQ